MALEDQTTGQDLLFYCLKFAGQSASTTDDYASDAKAAIRSNYWELLNKEPWPFALSSVPGVVTTVAEVKATAQSISSKTVTLSASISTSMAGRKMYMDGNQSMYRITAHTAGTNILTLDADYVDSETAGNITIYNDEYSLHANAMQVWGPFNLRGQFEREIDLINYNEFKAMYGYSRVTATGLTESATIIRNDSSGNMQIQIAPWSTDRINIEYDYTEFHDLDFTGSGVGDTPKLRREDRWIIAEFALWTLFRNKDDVLADSAWKRAEKGLERMVSKHLRKASKPRMWTRQRNSLSGR
ncbi:MAG: hypothetical protein ACE5DO_07410 [Desulfobacterales bacterium]